MPKVTVLFDAPEGSREPFTVTVSDECGDYSRTEKTRANEKAVFDLPEGSYRLCVSGGLSRNPVRQYKWIHVREGCDVGYCAVFRELPLEPVAVVTLILRDANYPNIIPLNGGITVCRISKEF